VSCNPQLGYPPFANLFLQNTLPLRRTQDDRGRGHHIGMSHPHDGYDSATGVDYGPEDAFFFAWAGDESNSMMSYIDLNWGLQPVRPGQQ
jgi:hypothetical protein